ncbi:MAG: hypothetical protein ACMXYB_04975 [Candidatus Woesearchaeota archaeon]
MKIKLPTLSAGLLSASLTLGAYDIKGNEIEDTLEQKIQEPSTLPVPNTKKSNLQEFCKYSIEELRELIPKGFNRVSILDDIPYSDLNEYQSLDMFKQGMPPIAFLSLNNGEEIFFGAEYLDRLERGDSFNIYSINKDNKLFGFKTIDRQLGSRIFRNNLISEKKIQNINENSLLEKYLCALINDNINANSFEKDDTSIPKITLRDILNSKRAHYN